MPVSRGQRWELVLLIGIAALVSTVAVLAGRFDLVSARRSEVRYNKVYTLDQARRTPVERLDGAWSTTSEGLSLGQGESGTLTIHVQGNHDGRLVVLLFGHDRPGFHRTLSISSDGQRFRDVVAEPDLSGTRIDLTKAAGHLDQFWLRIAASVESLGPTSDRAMSPALLSNVRVLLLNGPTTIPDWPLALLLVLTPALGYSVRLATGRSGALSYGFMVLGGLAILVEALARTQVTGNPERWWELVVLSQERDWYFLLPYFLLLVILGWQLKIWKAGGAGESLWTWYALGGILVWGASTRLGALAEMGWAPLDQDVVTYLQIAEMMTSPYDTNSREPMWIWLIRGWFLLVGPSPFNLRVLTVLLSLVMVAAAYKLFRDYTGRPLVGILVAVLLSGNAYLVRLSIRGLREEAYMIAVLCLVYLVAVPGREKTLGWQACGLALAGAAVQLLRFNSYTVVAPLILWWGWKRASGRWRLLALPVVFIVAVSIPHMIHNARVYGDPLYSVNVHFVWTRNYEFVLLKQIGCDGCPTREQALVDSTLGPTINAFQYLFGLHTVREVLEGTARGYRDLYLAPGDLFEIQIGLISIYGYVLYMLGLCLVLYSPYRGMLILIPLLANVVPFAVSLGVDPRIVIHTAPFVAFITAYGLARSIEAMGMVLAHAGASKPTFAWMPGLVRRGGGV